MAALFKGSPPSASKRPAYEQSKSSGFGWPRLVAIQEPQAPGSSRRSSSSKPSSPIQASQATESSRQNSFSKPSSPKPIERSEATGSRKSSTQPSSPIQGPQATAPRSQSPTIKTSPPPAQDDPAQDDTVEMSGTLVKEPPLTPMTDEDSAISPQPTEDSDAAVHPLPEDDAGFITNGLLNEEPGSADVVDEDSEESSVEGTPDAIAEPRSASPQDDHQPSWGAGSAQPDVKGFPRSASPQDDHHPSLGAGSAQPDVKDSGDAQRVREIEQASEISAPNLEPKGQPIIPSIRVQQPSQASDMSEAFPTETPLSAPAIDSVVSDAPQLPSQEDVGVENTLAGVSPKPVTSLIEQIRDQAPVEVLQVGVPGVEVPEVGLPGVSKVKKRNLAIRKTRNIVARKTFLAMLLGRQLAGPTKQALRLRAKGINGGAEDLVVLP